MTLSDTLEALNAIARLGLSFGLWFAMAYLLANNNKQREHKQ